jgi:hypothetical protein
MRLGCLEQMRCGSSPRRGPELALLQTSLKPLITLSVARRGLLINIQSKNIMPSADKISSTRIRCSELPVAKIVIEADDSGTGKYASGPSTGGYSNRPSTNKHERSKRRWRRGPDPLECQSTPIRRQQHPTTPPGGSRRPGPAWREFSMTAIEAREKLTMLSTLSSCMGASRMGSIAPSERSVGEKDRIPDGGDKSVLERVLDKEETSSQIATCCTWRRLCDLLPGPMETFVQLVMDCSKL